jgi:hypothetical protein
VERREGGRRTEDGFFLPSCVPTARGGGAGRAGDRRGAICARDEEGERSEGRGGRNDGGSGGVRDGS